MPSIPTTTYGVGGHDTGKPANNVVASGTLPVAQEDVNRDATFAKAKLALANNATFLALANPTAAQNTAQAKALTRQVNGLIRLLLNEFVDVSDT